jgi:Putative peptidoglycan binding domain/NlpC/P60 family
MIMSEPTVQEGSIGLTVKYLQIRLNRHPGVVKPPLALDAVFGPLTLAAVKAWQVFKKITVDGIVGPVTWATLLPPVPVATPLEIMESEIGKPYSEEVPERFGPDVFDCSGLIWYAFTQAGYAMPGGPDNDVAGLVSGEMQWLAAQPGSVMIWNGKVQAGDVLMFVGADPPGFDLVLQGVTVECGGHIGMATSDDEYVSAYDTQYGVCILPIANTSGALLAAVRPGPK